MNCVSISTASAPMFRPSSCRCASESIMRGAVARLPVTHRRLGSAETASASLRRGVILGEEQIADTQAIAAGRRRTQR